MASPGVSTGAIKPGGLGRLCGGMQRDLPIVKAKAAARAPVTKSPRATRSSGSPPVLGALDVDPRLRPRPFLVHALQLRPHKSAR